jgi:hypothetical protein
LDIRNFALSSRCCPTLGYWERLAGKGFRFALQALWSAAASRRHDDAQHYFGLVLIDWEKTEDIATWLMHQ